MNRVKGLLLCLITCALSLNAFRHFCAMRQCSKIVTEFVTELNMDKPSFARFVPIRTSDMRVNRTIYDTTLSEIHEVIDENIGKESNGTQLLSPVILTGHVKSGKTTTLLEIFDDYEKSIDVVPMYIGENALDNLQNRIAVQLLGLKPASRKANMLKISDEEFDVLLKQKIGDYKFLLLFEFGGYGWGRYAEKMKSLLRKFVDVKNRYLVFTSLEYKYLLPQISIQPPHNIPYSEAKYLLRSQYNLHPLEVVLYGGNPALIVSVHNNFSPAAHADEVLEYENRWISLYQHFRRHTFDLIYAILTGENVSDFDFMIEIYMQFAQIGRVSKTNDSIKWKIPVCFAWRAINDWSVGEYSNDGVDDVVQQIEHIGESLEDLIYREKASQQYSGRGWEKVFQMVIAMRMLLTVEYKYDYYCYCKFKKPTNLTESFPFKPLQQLNITSIGRSEISKHKTSLQDAKLHIECALRNHNRSNCLLHVIPNNEHFEGVDGFVVYRSSSPIREHPHFTSDMHLFDDFTIVSGYKVNTDSHSSNTITVNNLNTTANTTWLSGVYWIAHPSSNYSSDFTHGVTSHPDCSSVKMVGVSEARSILGESFGGLYVADNVLNSNQC